MILHLCQNFLGEELAYVLGSDRMEGLVNRYAYAQLALTHAEGAAQLYLVTEVVLGDQALQLLYDLAGSLNVAGATDANCDFQHVVLPLFVMFGGEAARLRFSVDIAYLFHYITKPRILQDV
jgi:hypothetical protein